MSHSHDRCFPFEKAHKLDDEGRKTRQSPDPIIEALDLAADAVLLDLGTGTGYFALPIAERIAHLGGEGKVLAVDVEPRMLEIVKSRAADAGLEDIIVPLLIEDTGAAALPVDEGAASRALLANIYHELPDRAASLRELHRVVRPEGLVLVVDWDPIGTTENGPPLDHRVARHVVVQELTEAAFESVSTLDLYEDFYAVTARRG